MSDLTQPVKKWFHARMMAWLDKRQPPVDSIILNQKILFVFPTSFGFSVLALVVLLYILGTNYQNNLILLLGYLLLSLVLLSIGLAFRNLAGLQLKAGSAQSGFVGDKITIAVNVTAHAQRLAISAGFSPELSVKLSEGQLELPLQLHRRGYFQLPRIKLESCHPFGLIRCWCYVGLNQHYWAYPTPISQLKTTVQGQGQQTGDLAWDHLASYVAGDPIKNIDWKKLARTPQQPVVKHYLPENLSSEHWLKLGAGPLETELSRLSAEALHYEALAEPYGLELGNVVIQPNMGPAHQHQVLRALALC